jgi:NAD(P)-dependent dehydrogenase (short-subunit alcohol dehydrogenase family)
LRGLPRRQAAGAEWRRVEAGRAPRAILDMNKRILVIGGTGNVGRPVVAQLTAAGASVRALVRDRETAALPPEVELHAGDLTQPATLDEPLRGVDGVFLVWTAPPSAVSAAMGSITSRCPRVVYLSAPIRTAHPFFQVSLPNPGSILHGRIEEIVQRSGAD